MSIGYTLSALLVASLIATAAIAQQTIIDGDSFQTAEGETIRIENIDTPSVGSRARCPAERNLADRTVARVTQLLQECPVVIDRRYRDRRGRTEARVSVCGNDLGETLLKEGLATIRGDISPTWCSRTSDTPAQ